MRHFNSFSIMGVQTRPTNSRAPCADVLTLPVLIFNISLFLNKNSKQRLKRRQGSISRGHLLKIFSGERAKIEFLSICNDRRGILKLYYIWNALTHKSVTLACPINNTCPGRRTRDLIGTLISQVTLGDEECAL